MRIHWPPRPLDLGAPLNLVVLSSATRVRLTRSLSYGVALGLAAALILVALDGLLFAGETVQRLPKLGGHPPLVSRVAIILVGSVGEELVFRVVLATVVAWLVYAPLAPFTARARALGQWSGVLVAAAVAGAWHVGSPPDALRVLTLSAVAGIAYGWLYWRRGLESAIVAHMVVTAVLYLAVPTIR